MRVTIDSRLRFSLDELATARVGREHLERLMSSFEHVNPQHAKLARINPWAAKKEPKVIVSWKRDPDGSFSLPRGGLERLKQWAAEFGIALEFDDRRKPGLTDGPFYQHNVALWDHQKQIVAAIVKHEMMLVRAHTGSGKTSAAIAAMCAIARTTLIMVYDGALLRQWKQRLIAELGIGECEIGIIGCGKFKPRTVTIAMQQTLCRLTSEQWSDLDSYFGCVIVDECHRVPATTFQKVIDHLSARYRIGMSATVKRKDGKEFLIYNQFGAVGIEIKPADLVAKNLVLDVEVVVVPTEFEAPWFVAAMQRLKDPGAGFDWKQRLDYTRLEAELAANAERTALATRLATECVVDGHQVILFARRREHCLVLNQAAAAAGIKSGLLVGSVQNAAEFADTIAKLNARELSWASGTISAVGQGLDIPTVARGVVLTPIATNKPMWGQVCGRLCRIAPGKADALIYYLYDQRIFGASQLRNLERWNNRVSVLSGGRRVSVDEFLKGEEDGKAKSSRGASDQEAGGRDRRRVRGRDDRAMWQVVDRGTESRVPERDRGAGKGSSCEDLFGTATDWRR